MRFNLSDVCQYFPGTTQEDWTIVGDSAIHNTANVHENAVVVGSIIGPNVMIGEYVYIRNSYIYNDVSILNRSVVITTNIDKNTLVGYSCYISDTHIGKRCTLDTGCNIDNSNIGDGCELPQNTHLNEVTLARNTKFDSRPIVYYGSEHILTVIGNGKVQIGCQIHTIKDWLESYDAIGVDNEYSENSIAEYKGVLDVVDLYAPAE